jgi:hypothetical protein
MSDLYANCNCGRRAGTNRWLSPLQGRFPEKFSTVRCSPRATTLRHRRFKAGEPNRKRNARERMMKALLMGAIAIGVAAGVTLAGPHPAAARDTFSFSFDLGDVAFAYSDGYWDHDHQWHRWHNSREAREYRARYREHWHGWKHDRDRDMGWRDDDHDGVPNRFDRHPENPYRQ